MHVTVHVNPWVYVEFRNAVADQFDDRHTLTITGIEGDERATFDAESWDTADVFFHEGAYPDYYLTNRASELRRIS